MKKSTFNWKALIRILMLILRVITNSNNTSKNRSNEPTVSEKKGDEGAKQDGI